MTLLGHVVSDQGVELDPRKPETTKNLPKPLTPIDIRSFLGLAGYYRRFMEGFSSIVVSLTALTKKKSSLKGRRLVRTVSKSSLQPRFLLCLSVVRITLSIVIYLGLVWFVFL